ncbi:MAG: SagB/ThcOx family dehydrogenase [Synergistaceae bacterium]|jgi:SagB-type dehydrogenase family enzyme|nr:SagB/ThcOx family dehydrogenase [Synergistaceae bacterium]
MFEETGTGENVGAVPAGSADVRTAGENAGRMFMRSTYYENQEGPSDQELNLPQPPLERPADPGKKTIPLPKAEELKIPPMDLRRAIEDRLSVRAYAEEPLTIGELSWLLWATQGVRKTGFALGSHRTYRTVPSAGGRHPFETYLGIRAVKDLPPGLYRFLALDHALQEVDVPRDVASDLAALCKQQSFVAQAAVTFIWMADEYRAFWRYKARGYRGIFQDAGHVGQNLYLAAANIGCGVCGIGAFDDLALARCLGADGVELFPAYAAVVGKLKQGRTASQF